MIKKISLLPYEAISQPNRSCWYLKSNSIPFCNSFICVHNLYRSFEKGKNEALAFNPKGILYGVGFVGFFKSLYSPFPLLVTITAAPCLQLWAWTHSSLKPKQMVLFRFRTSTLEVGAKCLSFPSFWISASPLLQSIWHSNLANTTDYKNSWSNYRKLSDLLAAIKYGVTFRGKTL